MTGGCSGGRREAQTFRAVGPCRRTCGGPPRWPRCCRCCTCTGCRPGTSSRHWPGLLGRTRQRAVADGDRPTDQGVGGGVRGVPGGATCRTGITSTSGRTGSTSTSWSKMIGSAPWSVIGARAGRHQGGDRGRGRVPGEHRESADGAARPEATGDAGAGCGGRRPRARLLGGGPGRLARVPRPRPASLGASIANVLDKLADPRSQPKAKRALHAISMYAESRAACLAEIGAFVAEYAAKYPKAVASLTADPGAAADPLRLPSRALGPSADHQPDRVDLRDRQAPTARDQGGRLLHRRPDDGVQAAHDAAQQRWRRLNAPHLVAQVRAGARFDKGVMVERPDEVEEVAA